MAFTTKTSGPMSEINVTPLVDVMLVNPNPTPPTTPLEPIHLKIDQAGALYWNDTPVDELGLKAQLAVIAQQSNQPEIQIAADDAVAYQYVARVLADAKSYNLVKIGFTENF